jgi:hypothetical protein
VDSDESRSEGEVVATAVDRLMVKLATRRVTVRRHIRVREGKRQDVDTHTAVRTKGNPLDKVTGVQKEAAKVQQQIKQTVSTKGRFAEVDKELGAVERLEKKTNGRGIGTRENPIVTGDVVEAANALGEGKFVRLTHKRQVSTLLDKLAEFVNDAKSKGENAPSYDLCRVSVKNTNLFCVESKGIPRVQMPQFSGIPEPGSRADDLEKNDKGEVDVGPAFVKYLETRGVKVDRDTISAEYLKASQNELDGAKIAAIEGLIEQGKIDPEAGEGIFVSNDDYVVDGHHRWAATVARGIEAEGTINMPIQRIQMDIISLLALSRRWTKEMGIRPKKAGETTGKAA